MKVNVDHKSEMEDILNKAGLTELVQRFIAEKIEPETITAATDLVLIRFGVWGCQLRVRKIDIAANYSASMDCWTYTEITLS